MGTFFTVDRLGSLRPGQVVALTRYQDINMNWSDGRPKFEPLYDSSYPDDDLQTHVDVLFPNGVSKHGDHYFLKNQSQAKLASPNIELLFEYVRRGSFPDKPSRFQSLFACETIEQANEFRAKYGNGVGAIYKVECNNVFQADMKLLTIQGSLLALSYNAHRYWSGLPIIGPDPFWEILLTPPVQILERVA